MSGTFGHILPGCRIVGDRDAYIISLCRGRRVVHLGCANSESIAERLATKDLLHFRILEVAQSVIGVDIDAASIARLQEHGVGELVVGDVEELNLAAVAPDCEVIVAGELLEHLQNPGRAMLQMKAAIEKSDGMLIISVPNAFSLYNVCSIAVRKKELVLDSHNVYYSPVTLRAFVERCGLDVRELTMYADVTRARGVKALVKKMYMHTVLRWFPYYGEGLIAVCRSRQVRCQK